MTSESKEVETFFGRCRCCLSYSYLKNMWKEYYFQGKLEIYAQMLEQCYGFSVSMIAKYLIHSGISFLNP